MSPSTADPMTAGRLPAAASATPPADGPTTARRPGRHAPTGQTGPIHG